MGEATMGMKATELAADSSPSSSRSHSAEVAWPPHAYADVGISVDYSAVSGTVSLASQHSYERVAEYVGDGHDSPLVVYQEVPSPFSQQGTSPAAVEAYVQVPFGALSRVAAVFRESPIPSTSDAQQQQYEQELETSQEDEIAAMSQVLDLHRSSSGTRLSSSCLVPSSRVSSSSPPSPSRSPSVLVVPGTIPGPDEGTSTLRPVSLESQLAMGPAAVSAALGLPILLDKSALVAASTSGRAGGLSLAQKYLLEQAQYLAADLSSRDLLPPILQGLPSSAGPSTSSHGIGFSHKSLLAHKFPHLLVSGLAGSSSGHGEEDVEGSEPQQPPQLLDYASSSSATSILDVQGPPLYAPHHQVSLPIDVFVMERGEVALVSSSAEDANDLLEDVQQYQSATERVAQQNGAVQSYVSSSADMVAGAGPADPGIHSTVDSTDESELHSPDEDMIDTSDGYVGTSAESHHVHVDPQGSSYAQQLELSSTEETSTNHARTGVRSVLRMQRTLSRREPHQDASPSASSSAVVLARADVCSGRLVGDKQDAAQSCTAASSISQPDSTRSPTTNPSPPPPSPAPQECRVGVGPSASSVAPMVPPSSSGLAGPGALRKPSAGRFWCEDCGQFYEHECVQHRMQLIVDKPVLTRAWASLPASYLYVHKVAEDARGEPVYGVFAKKSIPKRTQFGPIEGVLQRRPDRPQCAFPILVSEEENEVVVLDTSDETQSNWMRFVRPAQNFMEQNVILVQQETGLYFNTTRALTARTELHVWYSTAYAQRWGLPLLRPVEEASLQGQPQQPQQASLEHQQPQQQGQQQEQHQLRLEVHQPQGRLQQRLQSRKVQSQESQQQLQQQVELEQQSQQQLQKRLLEQQSQQQWVQIEQQQLLQHRAEGSVPQLQQGRSWSCFKCSSTFATSEELQRHLNQHEKPMEGQGSEPCPQGGQDTQSRLLRKCRLPRTALASKDTEGASGDVQSNRNTTSASQDAEGNDTFQVSKDEEYECEQCQKVFSRKYCLTRHLIQHTGEKKYKCSICDLRFFHPYNRKRHVMHHQHSEDRAKLQRVRSRWARNSSVPSQANGIVTGSSDTAGSGDNAISSWGCPQCRLVFHSPVLLDLHLPLHAVASDLDVSFELGRDPECCPECAQEFPTRGELIRHIGSHGKRGPPRLEKKGVPSFPDGAEPGGSETANSSGGSSNGTVLSGSRRYKCNLCYKGFASDERLVKHYQVHGNEDSKPLQCEFCKKRFLNNSALVGHLKTHARGERFFECPICKEKFHVITALKEHVYKHCIDGVYTCPSCGKTFTEYNQARKHIRAFHTDQQFPCNKCDKVFPRQDKLKLHMLCHSEHREFLCASCGKQFKRKDKLKEHMQRLHGPDREAREAARAKASKTSSPSSKRFVPKVAPTDYQRFIYKCHSCLLGFRRRGMLVNHLARRHPDVPLDTVPELNLPILKATRDYYCQYCEKVYRSSSKRKAHILKNHPGAALPMSNRAKGGVPTLPGEPNPTFSHMVGSVTTHPHNCCLCHKQYASKAKLLQHQRKKHMEMIAVTMASNAQMIKTTRTISTIPAAANGGGVATTNRISSTVSTSSGTSRGREADLLTQAMSELTQTLSDLRQGSGNSPGVFVTTSRAPVVRAGVQMHLDTAPQQGSAQKEDIPVGGDLDMSVQNDSEGAAVAGLDQAQIRQILAQYQQQAALSSGSGNDSTSSHVSVSEALVIPAPSSNWTIVSVTSTAEESFEQEFSPS